MIRLSPSEGILARCQPHQPCPEAAGAYPAGRIGHEASCTSKNEIDYVVTEYGVAQLRGKSASQRAQALIAIAHPDFRDELRSHAKRMHPLGI